MPWIAVAKSLNFFNRAVIYFRHYPEPKSATQLEPGQTIPIIFERELESQSIMVAYATNEEIAITCNWDRVTWILRPPPATSRLPVPILGCFVMSKPEFFTPVGDSLPPPCH
jgi:hypothetical protein